MCLGLVECSDFAPAKKLPHLRLLRRAAGLRDHWSRYERHEPCFEAYSVLGPNVPFTAIGGDENARVVHHGSHRRARLLASRRRAASSSCVVRAPCSASHSATASKPSRMRSARRAAAVIQAETLIPSASAASITLAWTLASTLIASFTAGLPRGMAQPYDQSSRVSIEGGLAASPTPRAVTATPERPAPPYRLARRAS
jgi:hypothetical protein